MNHRIEIRAEREVMRNRIGLHIIAKNRDGTFDIGTSVKFEKFEEGECFPDPAVRLDMEHAQMLMDELWRTGIRPTEGTGSAGSLAATERHLKDMQNIVWHTLKINQKGSA